MSDLLFEIGVEEMPAGYIRPALQQLADAVDTQLKDNRVAAKEFKTLGTPRRLTLWAGGLPEKQDNLTEEVAGPPAHVAFDKNGSPTGAAMGFARSQNVEVDELSVKETDKGPYVFATVRHEGKGVISLLPGILNDAAGAVNSPKSMRWPIPGDSEMKFPFARPIRYLTALFGNNTVPVRLAGLKAQNVTAGHPFLSDKDSITLDSASLENYCEKLETECVIPSYDKRRTSIESQLKNLESDDVKVDISDELLDEVAGLVEYPYVIEGRFDQEFLEVPEPVLVAAMTKHQRYFPMRDVAGKLVNRFAITSNRTAEQAGTVREGNERVLRARLADAGFFWDEDRKITLAERVSALKGVVYLGGLGNNYQRTERLKALAAAIAHKMELPPETAAHVEEAASLCKADLLTGLVGEFPILQGEVGKELALHEGQPRPVAEGIGEHYLPASSEGKLPRTDVGLVLSLADKIDTLTCCSAMGYTPDGSQDPFAMRRNAIGVLKILEKHRTELKLDDLLNSATEILVKQSEELDRNDGVQPDIRQTLAFFRDRLYHDAVNRGYAHDLVKAVLSVGFDNPASVSRLDHNVSQFWSRLKALNNCAGENWWPGLVEVVDRTYRIQSDLSSGTLSYAELEEILQEPEEMNLVELLEKESKTVLSLIEKGDYEKAAYTYCDTFSDPVHDFFDQVFVNVEDVKLREARKALCRHIYLLFAGYIADLYLIESPDK